MFRKYYKEANDDIPIDKKKVESAIEYAFSQKPKKRINLKVVYPCAAAVCIVIGSIFAYPKLTDKQTLDTEPIISVPDTTATAHPTEKVEETVENDVVDEENEKVDTNKNVTEKKPQSTQTQTPKATKKPNPKITVEQNEPKSNSIPKDRAQNNVAIPTLAPATAETAAPTSPTPAPEIKNSNEYKPAVSEPEVPVAAVAKSGGAAEEDISQSQENSFDRMVSTDATSFMGVQANNITETKVTLSEYFDYLGFDILSKIKVPEELKSTTEDVQALYFDDQNEVTMDEARLSYAGEESKYLDIIVGKLKLNDIGDMISNEEYDKTDIRGISTTWISFSNNHSVYFVFKDISFTVIATNIEKDELIQIIDSVLE